MQGARLGPGHRSRRPRRRLRQVPQLERDPDGRVFKHALPPALQVLPRGIRTEFGRAEEHRWITQYGFEEYTVGKPDGEAVEDGRNSRRRKYRKVTKERPGLVPSALFHIIGNTVFLRVADVASGLPPCEEQVLLSSMDPEEDSTGISQRSAYNAVSEELRKKLADALTKGSKRMLATYLRTLLAYPDGCTKGETVSVPRSEDIIVQIQPLSEDRLYQAERR